MLRQVSLAPVQSAFVVQSCVEPLGHMAAHVDVLPPPRPVGAAQQTPLEQLFVPVQASTWPMHAAAVVHVLPVTTAASRPPTPPPPTQQTCVAESHGVAPHAI